MFVLGYNKTKHNSVKLESEISLVPKATTPRKYQDISRITRNADWKRV